MGFRDPIRERRWEGVWSGLSLFASTGTLICCALPIALVSVGLGATLAGLIEHVPLLPAIARHKAWLFGFSALMLLSGLVMTYRPGRACPADASRARACERLDRVSRVLLWSGATVWIVGFAAAYLALPLARWLEG